MTLLKFELSPHVLQFTCGSEYPSSSKEELVQVHDRSASGGLKVEGYGVKIRQRTLVFEHMPRADYDALVDWYYNISQGALLEFEYTDEMGATNTVKIITGSMSFSEVYLDTWSGALELELIT